jgi:hypothetical protein
MGPAEAESALTALLGETVARLDRMGAPDEALATLKLRRFAPPKLVAVGRAWRLGVLLLDRDGGLRTVGVVTRAVEPLRGVANKSAEAEERRELRRAAVRGRFPEGEAVNVDAVPIPMDAAALARADGTVALRDGVLMVEWNRGLYRQLEPYLAERIALLEQP